MLVRWLGAYGRREDFAASMRWELTQREREIAAERFSPRAYVEEREYQFGAPDLVRRVRLGQGTIGHALVGMWLEGRAAVRTFPGDVWSVLDERTGRLVPTQDSFACTGKHTEIFCKPGHVRALVLKVHPSRLAPAVLSALRDISIEFSLDVYLITAKGKRVKVTREVRGYRSSSK